MKKISHKLPKRISRLVSLLEVESSGPISGASREAKTHSWVAGVVCVGRVDGHSSVGHVHILMHGLYRALDRLGGAIV